jgi:hypothetical protein
MVATKAQNSTPTVTELQREYDDTDGSRGISQADLACDTVQIRRSYSSAGRRRSALAFEPRAPSTFASLPIILSVGSTIGPGVQA